MPRDSEEKITNPEKSAHALGALSIILHQNLIAKEEEGQNIVNVLLISNLLICACYLIVVVFPPLFAAYLPLFYHQLCNNVKESEIKN